MKKLFAAFVALMMVLVMAGSVCLAESDAALTAEQANALYHEYLDKIGSREDGPEYYIGTVEYGELAHQDVDPAEYVAALGRATLTAADIEEAPEGEFVFLRIPDQCQFDFFQGEPEKHYVRLTIFGDTEKSILLQAVFPEDFYMTISGLVQMWANELATANGIPDEVDEELATPTPESGWLLDGVNGAVWMDDRASLEVIPEGDGYKLLITWASSAWETTEWTYAAESGSYDEETQTLTATYLVCEDIVYDDNNEENRTEKIRQECETIFSLNEEGQLVITNAADETLEGKAFTMIPASEKEESGLHADIQYVTESPEWVTNLPAAQEATQLFVVAGIAMDRTTAFISMHQKGEDGKWYQILSTPGFVGKNGLCADEDHREGCAQTPVGVYHFNKAFGIAADPGCSIPYFQVNENTYWSGDPDRQYNQMVDIRDVPDLVMDDSEHIMDYEYQYQYCLNISFNEDGTPGRGSAIFLHCFGPVKPWTGGCVAIPENIMKIVMLYVQEDCVVVIDTAENLGISF